MTDKPTITQADRDAAYDLLGGASPPGILTGREDTLSLIQALAKHRESSVAELQAEVERLREALEYYAKNHNVPDEGPWGIGSDDFGNVARAALAKKEQVE